VLVGALFLLSTATFIFSNVLISPLLASHNFLAAVADHSQVMIAASLIALIEGTATVGIALARGARHYCGQLWPRRALAGDPEWNGRKRG